MPAHERVIRTLLAWNVRVDEAFFMGGVSKTRILEAFRGGNGFDYDPLFLSNDLGITLGEATAAAKLSR